MNRFLLTAIFFLQAVFLQAQLQKSMTDSVYRIREVTVTSNRMAYFSVGNKIKTVDSSLLGSYSSSNLAQVLGAYSQVQINSYGLGLSNPSIRGTGSTHTAVLWNGFNLQDLLNGGVDCALLPINFFDDIKVQYGGCSALYGSGAIGGAIHLNNDLEFDKGFSSAVYTGYGSYNNMFTGLNFNFSKARYAGFVKSFYNSAKNDFPFKNTAEYGSPLQYLKNAERIQYGILAGNGFTTGTNSKLESYFWFQNNDKNIAPTMLSYNNIARDNQRDKFYRSTVSWKTWGEISDITIRTGFSDYFMTYNSSNFQSIQSSSEAEYNLKLGKHHLVNAGIDYTYEKGISESLTSSALRNRFALFTSYRFTSNESKWKVAANIRNELINKEFTPTTFSLGFERYINTLISVKGVLSRNYRVPTFDDLYWVTGGNANLKCELGLNEELGIVVNKKLDRINLRLETTGFTNKVSNWIQWRPLSNGNWEPENVSKVWARGLENDLSVSFPIHKMLIKATAAYTYTRSTKENEDYAGDPAYLKQLIYVPAHKGMASITMMYKGFTFYYAQSYSGRRYTQTDNSKSVAQYTTGNISISKKFFIHRQSIDIALQANNIWNTTYQVMEYYPMPLRNYQINIHLNIN